MRGVLKCTALPPTVRSRMSSRSTLQIRRHVREQDRDYSFRVPVAGGRITRYLNVPSCSDQSIWSHGPDIPNPIGEARIDEETCVVYKDKVNCLVCEEVCPVPEKAIRFESSGVQTDSGEPLREPKMIAERCIGCGICEAKCPAEPVAITVSAGVV